MGDVQIMGLSRGARCIVILVFKGVLRNVRFAVDPAYLIPVIMAVSTILVYRFRIGIVIEPMLNRKILNRIDIKLLYPPSRPSPPPSPIQAPPSTSFRPFPSPPSTNCSFPSICGSILHPGPRSPFRHPTPPSGALLYFCFPLSPAGWRVHFGWREGGLDGGLNGGPRLDVAAACVEWRMGRSGEDEGGAAWRGCRPIGWISISRPSSEHRRTRPLLPFKPLL